MLFTSQEFLWLLAAAFFGAQALVRLRMQRGAVLWLAALSLVFIAWWNPVFLPVILFSIAGNLLFSALVKGGAESNEPGPKKAILSVGIFLNLALLATFKYWPWFQVSVAEQDFFAVAPPDAILPLGISFYTFTQIAYLVDSWRSKVDEYDPLRYVLFVTFFPQLIAGPIVHHREMMPQFKKVLKVGLGNSFLQQGILLFFIGVTKKVLIADTLAGPVDQGFANPENLDFLAAWSVSLGYSLQLYFDFSGYTDMALGLAMMFGIKLPTNFNSPYKSISIQEFWRRWHMTLSRFLKEYLYIPLGGNRKGVRTEYFALILTFLLGGIWHGAGATFIVWGLLHGIALVAERALGLKRSDRFIVVRRVATFAFVNITWVFFRAPNLETAWMLLKRMFNPFSAPPGAEARVFNEALWYPDLLTFLPDDLSARLPLLILLGLLLILVFLAPNSMQIAEKLKSPLPYFLVISVGIFSLLWGWGAGNQIFLYFNF